ncbi:DUF4383 domain-containing protein [Thiohalomonas denitrificans]|uniref:DUF4383 domain-containing protein n=1 Tax=Thiohalomonas denitrificans TaxID=415747 RepID=A0A1G5QC31_9GAMM|nr:DUF4383 domain-containing protein [Thiohalomonas denitrificans]SCZ59257.1 protein of unknown function [Thiohalomonas denitrificans]
MLTRYFALVAGLVYLLVGIIGFFPAALQPPPPGAPELTVDNLYGYLFGIFPVNVLHSLVHLALGIWGVVAYRSFPGARTYARGLAWIYGILAIIGVFPALSTLFGLVPLFGHVIWLHAITALLAAYIGYMTPDPERMGPR